MQSTLPVSPLTTVVALARTTTTIYDVIGRETGTDGGLVISFQARSFCFKSREPCKSPTDGQRAVRCVSKKAAARAMAVRDSGEFGISPG